METFGHFFSSLLNMLGFTAEPSTESMEKSDSTSSLKEKEEKEEKESEKENDEKLNKNEESNETFVFIDVFENEEDKLRNTAHEIFLTSF